MRPSFRQSWNQSRQVMRLPVQLWKYSCAMTASMLGEVGVGRGVGARQHVFVVEDVEALVLHRAHVEVGDGDDHENVEIVFAAERLLVPAHGALERIHGVAAAVLLAGLDIDAQRRRRAPTWCGSGPRRRRDCRRPARTDRTASGCGSCQTAKWRPPGKIAAVDQIAVRQQHRRFGFVGFDARGVDRHHVGPVGKVGDAAEAFRLALRAIGAARAVEPGELGVGGRVDQRLDLERERPVRRLRDGQAVRRRHVAVRRQRGAVELERRSSVSPSPSSTSGAAAACRIGLERQRRAHLASASDAARRRARRSPPASRAGGSPSGGWAGRYRCAFAWSRIAL